MRQYEMCELELTGEVICKDYGCVAPEAVFTCGDVTHRVKGFCAGEGVYKVRFLPEMAGVWNYTVTGAATASGSVEVEPAASGSHGKVTVDGYHFRYQDGERYAPFGTTIYAMIQQTEELYRQTMETLAAAPFNKVRFCVFPKDYDFNENEPRFYAFEKDEEGKWDVKRPCFAYWDMLDGAILDLKERGIEADLILFHPYDRNRWGFNQLSEEESMAYLDYAVRRLSAMPNLWWSMANEYDLIPSKDKEQWHRIDEFLAQNDPYHHLISNHNCFPLYDHERENITHASIQTKMLTRVAEWREKYKKPVVVDECCYEGNIIHFWGSISGKEMVYRFWRVMVTGGYCTHGETFYDDNDILWWSKGGVLHGQSAARIRFLREIVESLPGGIDPVENWLTRLLAMTDEALDTAADRIPPDTYALISAMRQMDRNELKQHMASEYTYMGHVGEDACLTFYDLRTCTKDVLELPEDKKYKVELIDVWNMTRTTIAEGVSGKVEIDLPGCEGMASLVTRMDD